jgi:hypothetical protein
VIRGRAQRLQLAANGEWEKALVLSHGAPQLDEMIAWLDSAPADIAWEVFLAGDADLEQFFGIRLAGLSKAEQQRFCTDALRFFDSRGRRTGQDFLAFARDMFAAPQLLNGQPSFLEMGVVNAWRSMGPVRFASTPCAVVAYEGLQLALAAHPHYSEAHANPIAIELAFNSPFPHWLGVVVSRSQADGHRIDIEAASTLCRAVDAQQASLPADAAPASENGRATPALPGA